MERRAKSEIAAGSCIAVVGGGPAGSFFAIRLLRLLRGRACGVQVLLFEEAHRGPVCDSEGNVRGYRGCPYCAGGLSPRLCDELKRIGMRLPADTVQAEIRHVITHARWKHMAVPVPPGRQLMSVYRGRRPAGQVGLDAFLLDEALRCGARLIEATVCDAGYDERGRPVLHYRRGRERGSETADFVVFAGGINPEPVPFAHDKTAIETLRSLHPRYEPPPSRKALIVEIEVSADCPPVADGELHLFHLNERHLRLEMCSIIPKRAHLTVALIGRSVDEASEPQQNLAIIHAFLAHRSVAPLLPADALRRVRCICSPRIVTGTARQPVGLRVAAIGDMAASRLYKDGVLSAYLTATALAHALVRHGLQSDALVTDYLRALDDFRRDSASGRIVFLFYRALFSCSALSRVLYQAFASEIKSRAPGDRPIESIVWRIASGDDSYPNILRAMFQPETLWGLLSRGGCVTLRNLIIEAVFGLRWRGIQRYPTAVRAELVAARRDALLALLQGPRGFAAGRPEFERTYTIAVRCDEGTLFRHLGQLGDADRRWLRPRWVGIRRVRGNRNEPGCVIEYRIFAGLLRFRVELEQIVADRLLVYRVCGGFPDGGMLAFTVDPGPRCSLSIYLGFDYARGISLLSRPLWRLFRLLFPESVHDVIWNHALCELKGVVEESGTDATGPA
jgi:flavin-dependent dehydrogenase